MRRRSLIAAVVVSALLGTGGVPSRSGVVADAGAPVYGIAGGSDVRVLSRRDPRTLEAVGPTLPIGASEIPARFSPDGSRLAFVVYEGDAARLSLVDVSAMRRLGSVPLSGRIGTIAVRWQDARVVVAVVESPSGIRALSIDTARMQVSERALPGAHLGACVHTEPIESTSVGIVMMLSRGPGIGPVRLAVLRSGHDRVLTIARIKTGQTPTSAARRLRRQPAFVVDRLRGRAFVVGGRDEPIAVVDLRSLAVSYVRLRPAFGLSAADESERVGATRGVDLLAVSGFDAKRIKGDEPDRMGLVLVDARTGVARRVETKAERVWRAGSVLLARHEDGSLVGFGLDGRRRFVLTDPALPQPLIPFFDNGRYLYVPGEDSSTLVIDLASGAVVERTQPYALDAILSPADANAAWACS